MMNPDIKQKWIEALRSGQYKQGTSQLRSETNEYCCLGVLCDIAVQGGIGQWKLVPISKNYMIDDNDGILTSNIRAWSGFHDMKNHDYLIALNDIDSQTFEQIAEWIEVNL